MIYGDEHMRCIAEAVGVEPAVVAAHRSELEAAATWYRLDCRAPKRMPPSQLIRRLDRIASRARALLKALAIEDAAAATDGPQNPALLEALASAGETDEDSVRHALGRIGRLIDILEAARATAEVQQICSAAAADVQRIGRLTVPPGHQGDRAINHWTAGMLGLYALIKGREPGTSVAAPARPNEGTVGGPLVRFLAAAAAPLGLDLTPNAWRERVRLALRQSALRD